jgi:hypothetical protein
MTTHVNRTLDQPPMNSMATRGYKNANVTNLKGGYQEPYVVTTQFFNHRYGHCIRLNKVALKYPNFKKDVDPDVHVSVFNSIVKTNVKTYEEYIINVFSYMPKDTTSH